MQERGPIFNSYWKNVWNITNKKFRQALSVAIDRDDFIEVVSLGQGTPRQVTVMDRDESSTT